ncbi:MAG: fatty-acid--CoA ligase [Gordonia sp.]|nr:fatty-acid--CoA ligase [Gordonia sp. (in: high G+C Gram-positive bacteria)]
MDVRGRFAQLLIEAPDEATVIDFEDSWYSWGFVQGVATQLRSHVSEIGLGVNARIGVVLENRPEHIAVVVSVLAFDGCLVTFSALQPAGRLAADVRAAAAPIVIASSEVLSREGVSDAIADAGVVLEVTSDGAVVRRGGAASTLQRDRPDVAVEMLTSGTTGPPKRVHLSNQQLNSGMAANGTRPPDGQLFRKGVSIVTSPLVHISGFWSAVSPLYAGRSIAVLRRFDVQSWVHIIERHRPKAAGLVPAALRAVLDADVDPARLESLQVVTCGTAYCPPDLADRFFRRFGIRVLMIYGATEFVGAIAMWTYKLHTEFWDSKAGSAGRASPGVDLRVVDDNGEVLEPGSVGQLEVRSAQSPSGPDAWVRTSDLGRVDEDGFLFITGRSDDAIVRGGFKVHPANIIEALEGHPSVREAAVAPLPDQRLGQVPVAGVELVSCATPPTTDELIALCRKTLTAYEVPVHVVVFDALPRTPSAKVSRVDLLTQIQESIGTRHGEIPA